MSYQKYNIMIIEDNLGDLTLLKEVFKAADLNCGVIHYGYGELALEYLNNCETASKLPNLILLDINLRGEDGFTILNKVKKDERFRQIPVIVMSSSKANLDVARAYELHANAFMCKPINLDDYIRRVRELRDFWFSAVELPSQSE